MRELIWYNDPWGLHNGFYVKPSVMLQLIGTLTDIYPTSNC